MIHIDDDICIRADEVQISSIRASGPGGQHVNKVSTAVRLRFDIRGSSLPEEVKRRVIARGGRRLGREGVLHIKADSRRSLKRNREEAIARLRTLIREWNHVPRPRKPTRPSRGSNERRLQAKSRRSVLKSMRGRVTDQ